MSKKVLITGGTGFVGGHLLAALQKEAPGDAYHLTSLHPHDVPGATVHALNLTDAAAVTQLIQELQPDQIYHLASIASVPEGFAHPAEVINNNYQLTLNLLEAVRLFSPQTRILLVSSADIYQTGGEKEAINEETTLAPANPYSASKAAQDLLAGAYVQSFGLNIVRARPFNHLGVGQNTGFVMADFASQIAAAERSATANPVIKVGNLSAARDFTDVDDIVSGYILLMNQGKSGEIYNLGRGQAITIQSLLDQLLSLTTCSITVDIDRSKFRPVDKPYICADISKIAALGWQPQIPLEETLAKVLQYWREKMV